MNVKYLVRANSTIKWYITYEISCFHWLKYVVHIMRFIQIYVGTKLRLCFPVSVQAKKKKKTVAKNLK